MRVVIGALAVEMASGLEAEGAPGVALGRSGCSRGVCGTGCLVSGEQGQGGDREGVEPLSAFAMYGMPHELLFIDAMNLNSFPHRDLETGTERDPWRAVPRTLRRIRSRTVT